jgi:hypothetical protein
MVARPQFLFGGAESPPPLAVGIALMGAILSAGAYVTTKHLTRTNDPLVIVFYFALVTVVGSIPFNLFSFTPPVGWDWALLAGVGVATLGGQLFLTRALQLERPFESWRWGISRSSSRASWGSPSSPRCPMGGPWPARRSSSGPPSSWPECIRWPLPEGADKRAPVRLLSSFASGLAEDPHFPLQTPGRGGLEGKRLC